jgi:hypothetical protein
MLAALKSMSSRYSLVSLRGVGPSIIAPRTICTFAAVTDVCWLSPGSILSDSVRIVVSPPTEKFVATAAATPPVSRVAPPPMLASSDRRFIEMNSYGSVKVLCGVDTLSDCTRTPRRW